MLAVGVLIVNVQATAVPLVALLPLLPEGTGDGELARVLGEVREGLPAGPSPLTVLLGEVARYNWIMAAICAPLMMATGLASARFWRRRITGDPSARFMHSTLGVISALTAGLLLLMTVASTFSALQPDTALLGVIGAG